MVKGDRSWKVGLVCAAAVVLVGASSLRAGGPVMYEIMPVGSSTATEGRAITPDGRYVVGTPGSGTTQGFIWDAVGGSRIVDAGGTQARDALGVGYRTYNAQQEIVVYGRATGGTTGPTYWISSDGGYTFGPTLQRAVASCQFPTSNALAGSSLEPDAWYDVWNTPYTGTSHQKWYVEKGSGAAALPPQDMLEVDETCRSQIMGVSSTGFAVGWRKESTPNDMGNVLGYVVQYDGDGSPSNTWFPKGMRFDVGGDENYYGQLWAVAAYSNATDNRAGGMGPVDPDDPWHQARRGNWPYIVDDITGNDTGTAMELPTFHRVDSGIANNGIVYGLSQDGRYAVGMDYTLGMERAVLWDLADLGNIVETDLSQFAIDNGVVGSFTTDNPLRQAYAVGVTDDGTPVVTGRGIVLTPQGYYAYRAFVLYVAPGAIGDANHDDVVDAEDASILGAHWLMQSDATWEMGDFNGDCKVNDKDAAILAAHWSTGTENAPEPGTLVLLLTAAAVLWFGRRR